MTFQSTNHNNITGLQQRNADATAEIREALDQYSTVMGSGIDQTEVPEPERAWIYEVDSDSEFKKLKEEFQTKKTAASCNRLCRHVTAVLQAASRNAAVRDGEMRDQANAGLEQIKRIREIVLPKLSENAVDIARLSEEASLVPTSRVATLQRKRRLKAVEQWDRDLIVLKTFYKSAKQNKEELSALHDRMAELRSDAAFSILDDNSAVSNLQKTMKLIESSKLEAVKRLEEHFGVDGMGAATRSAREHELTLPVELIKGDKHSELFDSLTSYLRCRLAKHSAILIAITRRMFRDTDSKRGTFWRPQASDIPLELKEAWDRQVTDMYKTLTRRLPKNIVSRLTQTYTYGSPPITVPQGVQEDQGSDLLHALLCVFNVPMEEKMSKLREQINAPG